MVTKKKHMSKCNLSQGMHVTPPPYFWNLPYPSSGVGSQENAVVPPITQFYGHNKGGVMPAMLYGPVFKVCAPTSLRIKCFMHISYVELVSFVATFTRSATRIWSTVYNVPANSSS